MEQGGVGPTTALTVCTVTKYSHSVSNTLQSYTVYLAVRANLVLNLSSMIVLQQRPKKAIVFEYVAAE